MNRKIKVRFPNFMGDISREMMTDELKNNYGQYLIFDPNTREQVRCNEIETTLDLREVVVFPPISGG